MEDAGGRAWLEYARGVGKPLVIERLDFRQKKAVLEGESPQVRADAVQLQLWQGEGVLLCPVVIGKELKS